MTSRPLLHVGYHKTGTSYLQQQVFVSKNGFVRWPERLPALNHMLVSLGPFGQVSATVREEAQDAARAAQAAGEVMVVSHERLSGHPSSGGFDASVILDRLAGLFPGARVLITIREQVSMIYSVYGQYVREGGQKTLRQYLEPLQPELHRVPGYDPRFFEYSHLINAYIDRFGAEAVKVLPYEMLKTEPALFLDQIALHAGLDPDTELEPSTASSSSSTIVNRGDGPVAIGLVRLANGPLLRSQFAPQGITSSHRARLGAIRASRTIGTVVPRKAGDRARNRQIEIIRAHAGNRYAADNRKVITQTGLDLAGYGYSY